MDPTRKAVQEGEDKPAEAEAEEEEEEDLSDMDWLLALDCGSPITGWRDVLMDESAFDIPLLLDENNNNDDDDDENDPLFFNLCGYYNGKLVNVRNDIGLIDPEVVSCVNRLVTDISTESPTAVAQWILGWLMSDIEYRLFGRDAHHEPISPSPSVGGGGGGGDDDVVIANMDEEMVRPMFLETPPRPPRHDDGDGEGEMAPEPPSMCLNTTFLRHKAVTRRRRRRRKGSRWTMTGRYRRPARRENVARTLAFSTPGKDDDDPMT